MLRTPRCQAAIEQARKSYRRLGQPHVSSSHLVLGLLSLDGGPALHALCQAGMTPAAVDQFLATRREAFEKATEVQGALFGKSALEILAEAENEAIRFNSIAVDAEHVLLALLAQKKGEAADLFARAKVKREKIAETVSVQIR